MRDGVRIARETERNRGGNKGRRMGQTERGNRERDGEDKDKNFVGSRMEGGPLVVYLGKRDAIRERGSV